MKLERFNPHILQICFLSFLVLTSPKYLF